MSAPESVNGTAAPTIRRLPLPGAEPPDADAYRAIHAAGGHFLLAGDNKVPFNKAWQTTPADLPAVLAHAGRGGLVGVVPGSLGAVVVDLDPEGAGDTTPPLGAPVLQHATRRKGTHFWYRAPDAEVRNRKWARTDGGQHVGDVRGSRGFVILWDAGAVAAAVVGDDFDFAAPVDVSTLPWPRKGKGSDVEQMRAAANGERNDTHNRLAFARARRGENQATLRTAAIASGLTVAEVSATIRSAEEGAERNPLPKEEKKPPAGAYHAARAMEPDLSGRTMFVAGRGAWYWRSSDTALWQPDTSRVTLGKVQAHPARETCQRGLRSIAIMGELEGMLSVDGDLLDADGWTAGLPDGRVLNLRDGTVRSPVPGDLITMKLGALPDASGPPAVWLRFLGEALQYADDIDGCCRYLRWWIRAALIGHISVHRMIFLHGQSGTGKNTLADLVLHLAGDYGAAVAAAHVVSKRQEHRQWLAKLAGKRFALVGDLPTGGVWSADLQDLVGGATIEANLMRKNSIEFVSRVHVMATGNTSPTGQAGIWRRLVQFELRHKPTAAAQDTALPAKLRAEAGRILHWALIGDVDEPAMPAELAGAAEAVRDEQNPVAAWIRESWRPDPLRRTHFTEMHAAYLLRFADVPERDRLTETAFGKLLTAEFGPTVTPRPVIDGHKVSVRKCAEIAD